MAEKFFDLDFIAGNENARVFIAGIASKTIVAFNTNDLTMSNSNDFTNLFDTSKLDAAAALVDKVKASAPEKFKESLSGLSLRTIHNSLHSWTGSSRPPINLQLLFVSVRPKDDVRDPTVKLMASVFPTGNDTGKTITLVPPLGYQANADARSASGLVAVKIGNWFQATGLIVRSCEFTYSKEVTSNGTPLYATGSMTLEPFRVITFREYRSWFIGV